MIRHDSRYRCLNASVSESEGKKWDRNDVDDGIAKSTNVYGYAGKRQMSQQLQFHLITTKMSPAMVNRSKSPLIYWVKTADVETNFDSQKDSGSMICIIFNEESF